RKLLATCRSLAEAAGESDRPYYRRLEETVRPWLTPGALAQADAEILADLRSRCRQVRGELGRRRWHGVHTRARPWHLLPTMAALVAAVVLIKAMDLDPARPLGLLDGLWPASGLRGDLARLLLASVAVVLISIFIVNRTARN